MIPQFPTFKAVTLEDREDVEKFADRYPHYSDFNFSSLYAWDTGHTRALSILHENLVVRFTDYATEEPFLSFLGGNRVDDTAEELFAYAAANFLPPVLKMVPEISVHEMGNSFSVVPDEKHFDYVYLTERIASLSGVQYKSKRHHVERFLRNYPSARFEMLSLTDESVQRMMMNVVKTWDTIQHDDDPHEQEAIQRFFDMAAQRPFLVGAIFVEDMLSAFTIDEIVVRQYAVSHFLKATNIYPGDRDFLNREMARYLNAHSVTYWNWEQNLDVPNLRMWKNSYRPSDLLKKFTVTKRSKV